MRKLVELLDQLPGYQADAALESIWVSAVQHDSRRVRTGDLFVALSGSRVDGLNFVEAAVARGAVAVVAEQRPNALQVPFVMVRDARLALGAIAAAWYQNPSMGMRVVGVTGTDGKTTTTHILRSIFEAYGEPAGVSSTVGFVGTSLKTAGLTTPDSLAVQGALAEMRESKLTRAVLEVSSHGLVQRRVDSVVFRSAVCTNVDAEHLDYHGTFESYVRAKGRLFELVARCPGGTIVRNVDDAGSRLLPHPEGVDELTFGFGGGDIRAVDVVEMPDRTSFRLVTPVGDIDLKTNFVGRFNVANWLAASALAIAEGVSLEAIAAASETAHPVAGRMQPVDLGQPFRVVVDFAHTPQALAAALEALRLSTPGRLIVVFGHAGERDRQNRPRMGRAAAANADLIVLTMDDPYSEDPNAIIEEIKIGIGSPQPKLVVQPDRRQAIEEAFGLALPGDTVLIAGRGHETFIDWGDRRIPFDDAVVSREILSMMGFGASG